MQICIFIYNIYIYEMNKLKILGCYSEFHVSLDDHQTTVQRDVKLSNNQEF